MEPHKQRTEKDSYIFQILNRQQQKGPRTGKVLYLYINHNKDTKQLSGQHKVGPTLLQKPQQNNITETIPQLGSMHAMPKPQSCTQTKSTQIKTRNTQIKARKSVHQTHASVYNYLHTWYSCILYILDCTAWLCIGTGLICPEICVQCLSCSL